MSKEIERLRAEVDAFHSYTASVRAPQPPPAPQPAAFRSTAELTAAMRDPRYKNDPAYRDEVAQRLAPMMSAEET
ncbi:MAG: hypothetical protein M3Z20_00875 [Chloroflexota bacterium]|nr:hypothetical protein [Chloroflexota bacterium]